MAAHRRRGERGGTSRQEHYRSDVVVNKSVLLIEEPQFTLNTARHLRTAIRREAVTVVLVEVDDLIFDKLSRLSQIRS